MAATPGSWLDGSGPHADRVLSTRVRLARNLRSVPFPLRARREQLSQVLPSVVAAAEKSSLFSDLIVLKSSEMSQLEKQFLIERHLISNDFAEDSKSGALIVGADESTSIMVNEEDHLRIQVLCSGLQLGDTVKLASKIDDELDSSLEYAFSEELGYLTSCPTNVGTGMRASVLIHFPSLVLTKQISRVLQGIVQVGLAVRGFYGEGSEIMGNFFQISNQTTLGVDEKEAVTSLERVTNQIMEYEKKAMDVLMKDARVQIEDKVRRAYATLQSCRILTSKELISLASAVRFGISLGWDGLCDIATINELLILTQPAHIQKLFDKELSAAERNEIRAKMVTERLLAKK
ncbi:MAG: protein arginine kinase [Candidatus Eiseniibacteriota bacterium]|nr:MAG: protein arginine kinase [Candidatus Eisenbacteria bacterium]